MSDVEITWPRSVDHPEAISCPIRASAAFAAAVSAAADVVWIQAQCSGPGEAGEAFPGTTITFHRRGGPNHISRPNQWLIHFPALCKSGTYRLRVAATTATGEVLELTRDFEAGDHKFIKISSHYNSENITDQAGDFLAYGDLTARPLGVAKLTSVTHPTTIIYPTSTYSDYQSLFFWSAQFPTIPSGTYNLHVEDSTNASSDNISNLLVN